MKRLLYLLALFLSLCGSAWGANEIPWKDYGLRGQTLYVFVRAAAGHAEVGEHWDGDSWEPYTAATHNNFDLVMAETDAPNTGLFFVTMPAAATGPVAIEIYLDANDNGTPDVTADTLIASGPGPFWNGVYFGENPVAIAGTAASATNLNDAFNESGGSGVALALESVNVTNPAGNAVSLVSNGVNGSGLVAIGNGAGAGFAMLGGLTGHGLALVGGGTSGDGLNATATAGDGFDIVGGGTTGSGLRLTRGGASGDDLTITNDDAIINADMLLITGTPPELHDESNPVPADVVQISSDSTAANNAELMFDGTGYAGGTAKLGVSVSQILGTTAMADTPGVLNVNAYQISSDTTAATNLEAASDGTGFNLGGGSIVAASTGSVTSGVTVGTMSASALDQFVLTDTGETAAGAGSVAAISQGAANAGLIADAVWDEARAGHVAAGSFGERVIANATQIEGTDATDSLDARILAYGALKPTTAGRTLDITAGGNAGIDWANVESPLTALSLDNTTIESVGSAGDVTTIEGTDATDVLDARILAYGALKPTTAGRTLDITATGAAGFDWGNIENPTTSQNFSATTIQGGGGIDWDNLVADNDDVAGSFGEAFAQIRTRTLLALPAVAPAANGGLPTGNASNFIAGIAGTLNQLDDIELNPTIDVEVTGGGPVEHEPVADNNKRKISRRSDGTTGMNRDWNQRANETIWHSVDCSSQLGGGKTLTAIAAPTVTGGGGAITVGDYGVLGGDAKVRISVAPGTAAATTATIRLVLTPSVGAQMVVDCPVVVLP